MTNKLKRFEISEGINLNVIKDDRFKTGRISIAMYTPLEKNNVSKNAILPFLLTKSCKMYPDFTSLNKRLDELYGASIYADVQNLGDMQEIIMSASFLDDRYALNNECISEKITELLCDMLFNPVTINDNFSIENVNQEKRQLKELIESEYNDKRIFALNRCKELMCKDEKCGINKLGKKEDIQNMLSKDIHEAWMNLLETARFEIFVLGNFDETKALKVFKSAFLDIKRKNIVSFETQIIKKAEKENSYNETVKATQSKLVMGFRTNIAGQDEDVNAMRVAIALFGATPNSKLFLNVREKYSLCYYCSAKYDRAKGIMFVQSGVEKENIEKAKKEILNQLEEVKKGNFSDDDISAIKKSLSNSYKTVNDYLSSLETFYSAQVFDEKIVTPEETIEKINAVTKDQIVEVANKITLDTIYTLVGEA